MMNLDNKVIENLKNKLLKHHDLYKKIRCKAEYLEELLSMSLVSEGYNVEWKPASHEKKRDLIVNGEDLSVKSGVLMPQKKVIEISGHRLTRFNRNFDEITAYLNKSTDTLCVYNPQKKSEAHKYSLAIIKKEKFSSLKVDEWKPKGKSYIQQNHFGTQFTIHNSMSDQIWWQVSINQLECDKILI